MRMLQRAISIDDDDQADEQFGGQISALSAMDVAAETDIEALLRQLERVPSNDAEKAAKFDLYVAFLETVAKARHATFELFGTADFAEAGAESAQATIERSLANIDRRDNMAVDEVSPDRWFVHDMTRKAHANSRLIDELLSDICLLYTSPSPRDS